MNEVGDSKKSSSTELVTNIFYVVLFKGEYILKALANIHSEKSFSSDIFAWLYVYKYSIIDIC